MAESKSKKTKLSKPSVSLSRNGYKLTLSLDANDSDAKNIYIEKWVYEAKDIGKSGNRGKEHEKIKKGAKTKSWSLTLKKESYYPFVSDGSAANPKQSDYSQRIEKVVFRVWTEGVVEWTTGQGKKKKHHSRKVESDYIWKTYEFDNATKPSVSLTYNNDGNSFTEKVDINDDYSITSNKKKVTTRCWVRMTQLLKGSTKETVVSGHAGRWYNRDTDSEVRNVIRNLTIPPSTPIRYKVYAYGAGPGGKSDEVTAQHVFAKPLAPPKPQLKRVNALKSSSVENGYGIYMVGININTGWDAKNKVSWHPVDNVIVEYRDQDEYKGASDVFGELKGSWSTAKDNINSAIKQIQTDVLGAVADDMVRYFRIRSVYDGIPTPGYMSDIVAYGKPSELSGVSANSQSIDGKQCLVFSWSKPTSKLYGTDPTSKLYNGGVLGEDGRLRIKIFKNNTNTLLKVIKVLTDEWQDCKWVYEIPESDLDKEIDYCFQVCVGLDNLDPGARSDNVWARNIKVPAKCKNVVGVKQSNNTTVELTWDNPTKTDDIYNGIEIAWSTMPNAWESNSSPSTVQFENGAMTKAYITGLSAGEVYYFWVRRYEERNESTTYGIWSDVSAGVMMSDEPDTPVLTLSRSWIKEGGSLVAQWIYQASGNLPQTNAQIEIQSGKSSWGPIVNVDGEDDKCTVTLNSSAFPAGDYNLRATVANELGEAYSEPVSLTVATIPKCSITSSSIIDYTYPVYDDDGNEITNPTETTTVKALTALPLTVTLTGNGDLNLYVYCVDDYQWEHPDKTDDVFQGDCIWTSPVEAGDYTITDIALADNAKYRIQVECVDPDTNLKAEAKYIDFEVHWAHQAIAPVDSTVTINEDGTASLVAVKPEGVSDTDVCDIYRTTADGRHLCYRNAPWGATIIDSLPTFGETVDNSYCFCTRTSDSDETWCEIGYELSGSGIIVNYGSQVLKLPWNVSNSDDRTKQGEIRSHLGGSKSFYGLPYIDRSNSLSAEIVKMEDEDLVGKLYDLSRFTELCYVRTSNCIGYPAVVDVSINRDYNNQILSISLSAKEADAENDFLGRKPDEEIT